MSETKCRFVQNGKCTNNCAEAIECPTKTYDKDSPYSGCDWYEPAVNTAERLTNRNAWGEVTVSGKDDRDIERKYRAITNRLAELEDKLESGQMLELPHRVGDKVYLVRRNRNLKWVVSKTTVSMYLKHSRLLVKCACDSEWHETKDVFSDKTQAEVRLKELQGEL